MAGTFDPHELFTKDVVATIFDNKGTATVDHVNQGLLSRVDYKMPDEKGTLKSGRIEICSKRPYAEQIEEINLKHGIVIRVSNPDLLGLTSGQKHSLGLNAQ